MPKRPAAAEAAEPKKTETVARELIADGIYIGLPADDYHADPALGSSNIRDLLKGPNLFWHKSAMNPHRPAEKKTPSKIVGTATHRLLLDGRAAFDADYVRGPYGEDEDLTPAQKSALTKEAKARLGAGQELLSQADYDFILGCKEVVDSDPELTGCLDNGLAEVSIFWTTQQGIRLKARHDMLKVRGIGDIKTIANERERPLDQACRLDIATYRYDIPAAHYIEGRLQMPALLDDGKVFVGAERARIPEDVKKRGDGDQKLFSFLQRVCDQRQNFGFQLVFIPKKGAPDAWSCVLSPGNPILDAARLDIDHALQVYATSLEKFGTSKRWLPGHEVAELDINDMPYSFGRLSPRQS